MLNVVSTGVFTFGTVTVERMNGLQLPRRNTNASFDTQSG